MLVFRRVFVPSDCFIASIRGDSINITEDPNVSDHDEGDSDGNEVFREKVSETDAVSQRPQQPVLNLAISPNTIAFISYKLPPSAFIVTIGALRIDRLGHIGEASDSLCRRGDREMPGYLCPIGYRYGHNLRILHPLFLLYSSYFFYRARRIYWSSVFPNARESYMLTVSQVHKNPLTPVSKPTLMVDRPTTTNHRSSLPLLPRSEVNDFVPASPAYQRTFVEKMMTPIAASVSTITTSPGKIIPTPRCVRNSTTSGAFDPHPNNPVGLPLIRFSYPYVRSIHFCFIL